MKDITTNGGKTYTDAEWIALRGMGDVLVPDFIPTRDDLRTLALGIVKEMLDDEYFLTIGWARSWQNDHDYRDSRLTRVWDFLSPKVIAEVEKAFREGRAKVDVDAAAFENAMSAGDEAATSGDVAADSDAGMDKGQDIPF